MQIRGLFVAFEGPDGCGKTTISKQVENMLINYIGDASKVVWTREPGGTEVGDKIRDILTNCNVDPRTEALLFAASRTENTWKKIMVEKSKNKIVLCDRYIHSSLVYQGIVKKMGFKNVLKINEFGIGKTRPDILFYFDIDEKNTFERRMKDNYRLETSDRLENEFGQEDTIKKAINGYYSVLKFDNNKVFKINAKKSIDEICDYVFKIIVSRAIKKDESKDINNTNK